MGFPRDLIRGGLRRLGYRTESLQSIDDAVLYAAFSPDALQHRRFINIGAGRFSHRHWTNLDYATAYYGPRQAPGFLPYDLTALEPLPLANGSVELAYTSHTIEHVSDGAVENLFRECHRVLVAGGGLRVTCPDARLMFQAVLDDNRAYWYWRKAWFEGHLSTASHLSEVTGYDYFVREVATRRCRHYRERRDALELAELEKLFRTGTYEQVGERLTAGLQFDPEVPGEHINFWDDEKVAGMLRRTGFKHVYTSRRGQSRFAPMMDPILFDATVPMNSLYVEART